MGGGRLRCSSWCAVDCVQVGNPAIQQSSKKSSKKASNARRKATCHAMTWQDRTGHDTIVHCWFTNQQSRKETVTYNVRWACGLLRCAILAMRCCAIGNLQDYAFFYGRIPNGIHCRSFERKWDRNNDWEVSVECWMWWILNGCADVCVGAGPQTEWKNNNVTHKKIQRRLRN